MPPFVKALLDYFPEWRYKDVSDKVFVHMLAILVGLLAGLASVTLKNLIYFIESFFKESIIFLSNQLYFILPIIGLALVHTYT